MTTNQHIETEAAKHVGNYDAFIEAGGDAESETGELLFALAEHWMELDAKHQAPPIRYDGVVSDHHHVDCECLICAEQRETYGMTRSEWAAEVAAW